MATTIADALTLLANNKAAIKQAIIDKGVSVSDNDALSTYASKIESISGGSIEDLITKENLVRIEGEFVDSSGGEFVLDASNNFNKTYPFLGASLIRTLAFNFNGTNMGGVELTDKRMTGTQYVLLTVGSTILQWKVDTSYVGGYKHIYFYINNEIVGTINYDD